LISRGKAEHHREAAEAGVVVGVADAGGLDLDEDLVIARVVEVELLDRQRRACLPGDGGLDLHAVSLRSVECRLRRWWIVEAAMAWSAIRHHSRRDRRVHPGELGDHVRRKLLRQSCLTFRSLLVEVARC
jgi:hypothetical protein